MIKVSRFNVSCFRAAINPMDIIILQHPHSFILEKMYWQWYNIFYLCLIEHRFTVQWILSHVILMTWNLIELKNIKVVLVCSDTWSVHWVYINQTDLFRDYFSPQGCLDRGSFHSSVLSHRYFTTLFCNMLQSHLLVPCTICQSSFWPFGIYSDAQNKCSLSHKLKIEFIN